MHSPRHTRDALASRLMAVSVGVAMCLGACAAGMSAEEYQRAQSACAALAKTRAESDACRAELRKEYVQGSDGGHP